MGLRRIGNKIKNPFLKNTVSWNSLNSMKPIIINHPLTKKIKKKCQKITNPRTQKFQNASGIHLQNASGAKCQNRSGEIPKYEW